MYFNFMTKKKCEFYEPFDGCSAEHCIESLMRLAQEAERVHCDFNGFGSITVTADMTRDQIWQLLFDRQESYFAEREKEKLESIERMKSHVSSLENLNLSDPAVAFDWLCKFGEFKPSDFDCRYPGQRETVRKTYDLGNDRVQEILEKFKRAGYRPQVHSLREPIQLKDWKGLPFWGERDLTLSKVQVIERVLAIEFETGRLDVARALSWDSRHLPKEQ